MMMIFKSGGVMEKTPKKSNHKKWEHVRCMKHSLELDASLSFPHRDKLK